MISFGGGINQDVTGFVASTLYRGINWIYVPTTLLAMADSAIGLKTSLNHESYKNVLGTFYPPSKIFICAVFFENFKKIDYMSGVGEIIKFMLMKKGPIKDLDDTIKKIEKLKLNNDKKFVINIIKESIEIKKSYMEGDEFDSGKTQSFELWSRTRTRFGGNFKLQSASWHWRNHWHNFCQSCFGPTRMD